MECPEISDQSLYGKVNVSENKVVMLKPGAPKLHVESNVEKSVRFKCKKSVDKIYDLLKKLENIDNSAEVKSPKSKFTAVVDDREQLGRESLTTRDTNSGTSLKHQPALSSNSNFSFANPTNKITEIIDTNKGDVRDIKEIKVDNKPNIIQKSSIPKAKKAVKLPEDPLKMISELIQNIDHVQKRKMKSINAKSKPETQPNVPNEIKIRRPEPKRNRIRSEPPTNSTSFTTECKNIKPPRISKPASPIEDRIEFSKRNIIEIIDEQKEARGEAVRGPRESRINSLAQPRRLYVMAHKEEMQSRPHGKMVERAKRLSLSPVAERRTGSIAQNKVSERQRKQKKEFNSIADDGRAALLPISGGELQMGTYIIFLRLLR